MSVTSIVIVVLMLVYAVYRQSQKHAVVGATRFKLAIIYGIVGLVLGGFALPDNGASWGLFALGVALSVVVGAARGRLTRLWVESGTVWSQGTALTIGLFLGLVLVKVGLGTVAYLADITETGGIGEIVLMIAVMVAIQAEIVWRRARALGAPTHAPVIAPAA